MSRSNKPTTPIAFHTMACTAASNRSPGAACSCNGRRGDFDTVQGELNSATWLVGFKATI